MSLSSSTTSEYRTHSGHSSSSSALPHPPLSPSHLPSLSSSYLSAPILFVLAICRVQPKRKLCEDVGEKGWRGEGGVEIGGVEGEKKEEKKVEENDKEEEEGSTEEKNIKVVDKVESEGERRYPSFNK